MATVSTSLRAEEIYQKTLKHYVAPARDAAMVEALNAFIDRRTAEGGAPLVG